MSHRKFHLQRPIALILVLGLVFTSIPVNAMRAIGRISSVPKQSFGIGGTFSLTNHLHLLKSPSVTLTIQSLKTLAASPSIEEALPARQLLTLIAHPELVAQHSKALGVVGIEAIGKATRALQAAEGETALADLSAVVTQLETDTPAEQLFASFYDASAAMGTSLLPGFQPLDQTQLQRGLAREDYDEDDDWDDDDSWDGEDDAYWDEDENDVADEEKHAKAENSVEEATRELFRLRHQVQMDAREILNENLGGDVGDGKLHRDVNRILHRLLKAAGLPKESAQVFIGNSFLPNAFTTVAPSEGAYLNKNASVAKAFRVSNIFISLGLLRSLENEDQLAFILAHELQHNYLGHLKDFTGGAAHVFLGHFQELDADSHGLKLAAAAGYKPDAAIDSLYALDREYDRIEKQYSLMKRDKSEVAQSLERLRDVHPHADIRRANMLDFLNEALEVYAPQPIPENPIWVERSKSSERPTHIDRFENKLKAATEAETIEKSIYNIESFIQRARANAEKRKVRNGAQGQGLSMEKYAVIEEAYRRLLPKAGDSSELRPIEVSVKREQVGRYFPSRKLRAGLITRQLDLLFKKLGGHPTLEEFLRHSSSLSPDSRQAGTMRILGSLRTREDLDQAFRTLSNEAESLGLDLDWMEEADIDPTYVILHIARRLWRSTRRIMTEELGRAAKPEDIIDHLIEKISPAWRHKYLLGFNVEILESAHLSEEFRSAKFRPSELAGRMASLSEDSIRDEEEWDGTQYEGLNEWTQFHYTPPQMFHAGGKMLYRYERYYVKGLQSPNIEDQLDIVRHFGAGFLLTPPFLKVLRNEGTLDTLLRTLYQSLGAELETKMKSASTRSARDAALRWYHTRVQRIMGASLFGLKEFDEIVRTVNLAWNQVEKTIASEEMTKAYNEENKSFLATKFFDSLSMALRLAVVQADLKGERPKRSSFKKTTRLVRRIEKTLGTFPGVKLVQGHARNLEKNLGNEKKYMKAYMKANPSAVLLADTWLEKIMDFLLQSVLTRWLARVIMISMAVSVPVAFIIAWPFVKIVKWIAKKIPKRKKKKAGLPGVPEDQVRYLGKGDYVHFLAIIGDAETPVSDKLMSVALLDRLDMAEDFGYDQMGRVLGMRPSSAAGRWMLEDIARTVTTPEEVRQTGKTMLRLSDLHPGLLQPDMEVEGSIGNAFRTGAEFIKRNEPYRSLAKGEHPFRGVNTFWADTMMEKLDATKTWPEDFRDKLDLMDFLNSNGEFSDAIDERILDEAKGNRQGFLDWRKRDKKKLKRLAMKDDESPFANVETPVGTIPIPKAQPLKIVRNPALRTKLFDLLPESRLKEKPPRMRPIEWIKSSWRILKAYRAARKYYSAEFLKSLRNENAMEDKFLDVLEETDRLASERSSKARERWDQGEFSKEELKWLKYQVPDPKTNWKSKQPHEKAEIQANYKNHIHGLALSTLWELYNAFAGRQEPLLGLLLDNYPEPTRSRDELLERIIKARKLSGGGLIFLESHKSYRMPNPVRIAEKHLMDQAVIQLKKFSSAEKVDILLHLSEIELLDKDKLRLFNKRILTRDRKKIAREYGSIKSISQLQNYMSLLHRKDRALLVKAMFYGEYSLHNDPKEVERLFERLVIVDRKLPKMVNKIFRAYFKILTGDEKAKFISDLAALENVRKGLSGPEILSVALAGNGVTGAKIAQVLATHKGLLPEEYARALERFKDKAQDMEKMRAHGLIEARMSFASDENKRPTRKEMEKAFAELDEISQKALPSDDKELSIGPSQRRYLVKQVDFLLREQGRRIQWIEKMGPELGAGSIKIVYKITLDDGKTWVAKIRAPGASYRVDREFQIIEQLVSEMEAAGDLDVPGVRQLLDEVKKLVQAEMDFRDEAKIEWAMRDRIKNRPWYARLLSTPKPFVPRPHDVYISEDLMIEQFVPVTRFADLPTKRLIGASKEKIAKLSIREGMLALVLEEWLEPDPHTGNRMARSGFWYWFRTKLALLDLGQGSVSPIERLKPMMKAGLDLQEGDIKGAAKKLLSIITVAGKHTETEVLAAMEKGLEEDYRMTEAARMTKDAGERWDEANFYEDEAEFVENELGSLNAWKQADTQQKASVLEKYKNKIHLEAGTVERMMDALIEAEKMGALVKSEYAALQKAFLIYAGYGHYLPKDYFLDSLERAVAVRLRHDGKASLFKLAWMKIKMMIFGKKAVRAEFEALIDGLSSRLPREVSTRGPPTELPPPAVGQ